MFVINLHYKVGLDIVNQYVVEHRDWLDTLYAQNKLLCSGPKDPRDGGIILALTDDLVEVKTLMLHDPFFINGVAEYTFTKFLPNKFHATIKL